MKNLESITETEKQEPESDKQKFKHLLIEDVKYKTLYNKKFENRKFWKSPEPKKIISFIPGTILKVQVVKGQKVKKGDEMILLEAMKMANNIKSPDNAVIKDVYVKPGDKIAKGFLMVEFE